MHRDRLRVVVAGMIAGVPGQGGAAWAVLQWVLGLRRLGHDVLLLEPVASLTADRRDYFGQVVNSFGLRDRATLVTPDRECEGVDYTRVTGFCRDADLLLNVAGMLDHPELFEVVPVRVYLDLDPVFTQLWHTQGIDMRLERHTHFVTVGLNIGDPGCDVPLCGVDWITTLPPVLLDFWPVATRETHWGLTTVANWRGYGPVEQHGVRHGQKVHSWRTLFDLPGRAPVSCEPALAIHPEEKQDLDALDSHGWRLVDPATVAGSPAAYHLFVQSSWGELCVAKEGYVVARSGWFSDRSACYLASGRPVIAQDTGFSTHLPTGQGLLDFSTVDEAAEAVREVSRAYDRHRRSARHIAMEHLSADDILSAVLHACASSGRYAGHEA